MLGRYRPGWILPLRSQLEEDAAVYHIRTGRGYDWTRRQQPNHPLGDK